MTSRVLLPVSSTEARQDRGIRRLWLFSLNHDISKLSFLESSLHDFHRVFAGIGCEMDEFTPILGWRSLLGHLWHHPPRIFFVVFGSDCIVVRLLSLLRFRHPGVVLWIQGSVPDESFARHQSRLRRTVLIALEYLSLLSCSIAVVVSNEEQELLGRRLGGWVRHKIVVLPNLLWSDVLPKNATQPTAEEPGEEITFAYVGGVGVWQNFDLMLALYAAIDTALQRHGRQSILRVVVPVPQRHLAERMVQQHRFRDQPELSSCQPSEVAATLVGVDFGFLLRDNSVVNQVASPLKLRDYLGAGVRVVVSGEIGVLHDVPALKSSGLVLGVSWVDLEKSPAQVAEHLCTEILRRRGEPLPWDVLRSSFTYEAWVSAKGVEDALRRRLATY